MASPKVAPPMPANDSSHSDQVLSPLSKEVIVGIVGYAGAGCSTAAKRLKVFLQLAEYEVHEIKLSALISEYYSDIKLPELGEGVERGPSRLNRSLMLQDMGDELRSNHKNFAVAALGVSKIKELRGDKPIGAHKIAYIVDSIKHKDEVIFLREV